MELRIVRILQRITLLSRNLAENIIPTGESALDSLLLSYQFDSVKTLYGYPQFPWLKIFTDEEYNLIPIEKAFSNMESVQIAEFNKGCIGGGNSIELTRYNDRATITFSIASGDCPSGCINHKCWEFNVSQGVAEFVRTY